MQQMFLKSQIHLMKPIIFFLLPLVLSYDLVRQKTWPSAHSKLIVSLVFYNDDTKMVSGSSDDSWKVWDTATYEELHQQVMGDYVTHVNLHPYDNRIFVTAFDGEFAVYDPDNYSLLHSSYPAVQGNTISFIDDGDKFVMAGYDSGSSPQYYIYNSTDYSLLQTEGPTSFSVEEQITASAVDSSNEIIAFISLNEYATQLWNLTTNTQQDIFNEHTNGAKSVIFHPDTDDFYTCGLDGSVIIHTMNDSGYYEYDGTFDTSEYGGAYSMNANLSDVLLVSANNYILVFDLYGGGSGDLLAQYGDQADIFVMGMSYSHDYLVTGMENGKMSLWYIEHPFIIQPEPEEEGPNIGLIVGATVGGVAVLVIIVLTIYCCVCKKKKSATNVAEQLTDNSLADNKQLEDRPYKFPIKQQLIMIEGNQRKKRTESEKSSDYDYDDLIEGNVIVIKDDEKKKKYIKHLKKQQSRDDDEDYDKIMTEGTIIVIKDQPIKKNKRKKKFAEDDDDDDPTYQQLMAEGTVIVIKDDEMKKKYVEALKKEKKQKKRQMQYDDEDSDDPTYQQLMAEGTVIVIKEDERKKRLVEFLKEEHRNKKDTQSDKSSDIQYDQLMAQGTIVVIKDEEKKKKYVEQLKKQQQEKKQKKQEKNAKKGKKKQENDSDSDVDYEQLMAEGQIIVIKDDQKDRKYKKGKDEDSDDPDYEQLMAEGTVIVIKDDVMKKKYIDHKKIEHDNKRGKGHDSDISSDPDYEQIMAQGHIIIIKETDEKKEYFTHLKKDKEILKENKKKEEQKRKAQQKLKKQQNNQLKVPQKKIIDDDDSDPDFMNAEADIVLIGSHKDQRKKDLEVQHYKKMMQEEKSDIQND